MRAHLRRYIEEAKNLGAEHVHIEHRGTAHPRLKGRVGDHQMTLVVGGSTHQSGASVKNGIARLRRLIRAMQ